MTDARLVAGVLRREARRRVARAVGLGGPTLYRPNVYQWEVLLALKDGPLPTSQVTTVQAHVNAHAAGALEQAGLVAIEDGVVVLTDRGATRVRMGW